MRSGRSSALAQVAAFTTLGAALAATSCHGGANEARSPRGAGGSGSSGDAGDAPPGDGLHGTLASLGHADVDPAEALAAMLKADRVEKGSPVRLDGVLKEWGEKIAGRDVLRGGTVRASFFAATMIDDARLYVGAEVSDDTFVRTSRFAETEDHASIVVAFPVGASFAAYEIGLFAGRPGQLAGAVRYLSGARRGQDVAGARIVEAPLDHGYSFEAAIPWTAFPEAQLVRVGMRGAFRYTDVDASGASGVLATGPGDVASPADLPPMPIDAEQAMFEQVLLPRGLLGRPPTVDLIADVAGDPMKERVAVWGQVITITGPSYRRGREFFYRELGDADLVKLEARDVTGRGKDDLLVDRRWTTPPNAVAGAPVVTREHFEVWSILPTNDEPVTTFAHEIAIAAGVARGGGGAVAPASAPRRLTNTVHVGAREIEVAVGPAVGWDRASFHEPPASDVEPLLVPWGATRARTFKFDGAHFVAPRDADAAKAPRDDGATDGAGGAAGAPEASEPRAATAPARGGDLSAQVIAQFRRDHGIPDDVRARWDLAVNVAEDTRPERVVVIGRDVVVAGPGFRGGDRYASVTLAQFERAADVRDVTMRDVTGDGAAEIIVRGVRRLTAAGGGAGNADVEVDALFVYEVKPSAIARIFGIETGREQAGKRVQGPVQFVPAKRGRGLDVDVRPGSARGWTQATYPWGQEAPGSGPVEPLLLPWGGIAGVRYAYDGTQFTKL